MVALDDVMDVAIEILHWGVDEARERGAMWDEAAKLLDLPTDNEDVDELAARIEDAIGNILALGWTAALNLRDN